jgi:hypothetical protein
MTGRSMQQFDDAALEGALRSLGDAIAWPAAAPLTPTGATVGPDIATRVRVRLSDTSRRRAARGWFPRRWQPLRRSLVLALIALLALAVIAGAAGLGLPGLRFLFGGGPTPPPTPPASPIGSPGTSPSGSPSPALPTPLGGGLQLGQRVSLEVVEERAGIPVRLPTDDRLGPPDAVWIDAYRNNQVAYVWRSSARLPDTNEPGIGLLMMQFDGTVDEGFFDKVIHSGTTLERVSVAGQRGYWISGDPHFFYYVGTDGRAVDESRRWVGDALVWSDGSTTYRIESALGRDATIAIAESME